MQMSRNTILPAIIIWCVALSLKDEETQSTYNDSAVEAPLKSGVPR